MMNARYLKISMVVLLAVSTLLTACSGRQDDLGRYITEVIDPYHCGNLSSSIPGAG